MECLTFAVIEPILGIYMCIYLMQACSEKYMYVGVFYYYFWLAIYQQLATVAVYFNK